MIYNNGSTNAHIHITERFSGTLPKMGSIYFNQIELEKIDILNESNISYTINDLELVIAYHMRVLAWNGVDNLYVHHNIHFLESFS